LGKAPEAFRTISEVANELDVPKHVLRFWETKFAQVKPMKRGGNRRYYRPEDVDLLRGIRKLLHDEGYTIRGLQKVLRDNGVNYVKNYWRAAGASDAPAAKAGAALPDLAGEAAGHARKAALERAKTRPKRQSAKPGPGQPRSETQTTARESGAAPNTLNAGQRRQLEAVLVDLEECRDLLAQKLADKPGVFTSGASGEDFTA